MQALIKKTFLCLSLLLCMCPNAMSQFYAGAGYGKGIPWDNLTGKKDSKKLSYGKGAIPNVYFGYVFRNGLGLELGLGYFKSDKIEKLTQTPAYATAIVAESEMLRISPSFRLAVGDTFQLYIRSGPVLGVGAMLNQKEEYHERGAASYYTYEFSGRMAWGASASIGACYSFTSYVGIYVEAGFTGMDWAPKRSVATRVIFKDIDLMDVLTTSEKEVLYVTKPGQNPVGPDHPREEPKVHLPFGSCTFQAGIHISF